MSDSYFWDRYAFFVLLFTILAIVGVVGASFVAKGTVWPESLGKAMKVVSSFSWTVLSACLALLLFQIFISALITFVFLAGVGVRIDFVTALFLSSLGNIILMVSVTPGNLGTKELAFVGVGMLLGISESPMLAVLIAERLLQILLSAGFSAFFFYRYRRPVWNMLSGKSRT